MPALRCIPNLDDMTTDRDRKRRLAIFGGIVLVAIVAVAVVIGLSSGGSDSKTTTSSASTAPGTSSADANGLKGTGEIAALLKGIPQQGNTLGSPTAPAT